MIWPYTRGTLFAGLALADLQNPLQRVIHDAPTVIEDDWEFDGGRRSRCTEVDIELRGAWCACFRHSMPLVSVASKGRRLFENGGKNPPPERPWHSVAAEQDGTGMAFSRLSADGRLGDVSSGVVRADSAGVPR